MIIYKTGNLLDTPDKYIVHGCNSLGIMGAGLALLIKNKYPSCFEDYKKGLANLLKHNGNFADLLLGKVIPSHQDDGKIILNCITQLRYGRDINKKYASYDAIYDSLVIVNDIFKFKNDLGEELHSAPQNISMPKIGCGLGGADWEIVEGIIKKTLQQHNVTIWSIE